MLHLNISEATARLVLGVVQHVPRPMLLGTSFSERCIPSIPCILPGEQKIIPHHSPTVHILLVQEGDGYNNPTLTQVEGISILQTTPQACFVNIIVARETFLRTQCEPLVLVTSKSVGIVVWKPNGNVWKRRMSMVTRGFMHIYADRPFYVNVKIFQIAQPMYKSIRNFLSFETCYSK